MERQGPSRRSVIGAAVAAGAAWVLAGVVGPESADAATPLPPGLPAGLQPYRQVFRNWSGEVATDELWTCSPTGPEDLPPLADWARAQGWRLRAQGHRHTWAPLTVADGTSADARVLLVDTTGGLTAIALDGPSTVRVQTGATMEALLAFLAGQGLGVTACPAPGELTVGGVLAIGGHGTALDSGTLSNLLTEFTAVVYDETTTRYTLRTFRREEADSAAFLVHLGRAFLTEAVLRVVPDRPLRCLSRMDIPVDELLGPTGRTLASFVESSGRAEVIWYAFTDRPWLKVWSDSPGMPFGAHLTTEPYNYPFSDNIPEPVARLAGQLVSGAWGLAPTFGQLQALVTEIGLTGDLTDLLLGGSLGSLLTDLLDGDTLGHLLAGGLRSDLWGASRTLLQYVRPTTLRVTANGYAILTGRADLQWVVGEFAAYYRQLLGEYQARGEFPVNGAVEIRVTGLDDPARSGVPGARPPLLSALRPQQDRSDWDTAVWLDVLTLPGTPGLARFGRELEQWLLRTFDGTRAAVRVEWSKGWAYSESAAWSDPDVLHRAIPQSLAPGWAEAVAVLDRHDPDRVFGNDFLDQLLH